MHVVTDLHFNLSRIEWRIQQQKRYIYQYLFRCFPCGCCKDRIFLQNNYLPEDKSCSRKHRKALACKFYSIDGDGQKSMLPLRRAV